MCGILGFVNFEREQRLNPSSLLEYMEHRGPDAKGFFHGPPFFLGHNRLSILDLTNAANQPMYSHCRRFVMVYNGEVYNYREVEQEIRKYKPSFRPHTRSDSEIILEAFVIWGEECVKRLNGMFAIAILDQETGKLYLFRDRMGIKPLYYFNQDGRFAFASELKVLAKPAFMKKYLQVDKRSVNQFLHLGYIPAPGSIYSSVRKLPPGHWGVWDGNEFAIKCWWDLRGKVTPVNVKMDFEEAKEQLRDLVVSAVKYRLISDVPYGTFLSGGIDSSLVTAVAQSLHSQPINTFTIGSWDKAYDESGYAQAIAEHLKTNHHALIISEKDALEWMPALTGIYDEPFADSSAIPTLLVSRMARQHVTVTLSGDGGDELFMGYGAYLWAQRLANPIVKMAKWPASQLLKAGPVKYRRAARLFDSVPRNELKSHIFSQEQYLFARKEIQKILRHEYQEPFHLNEVYHIQDRVLHPAEQQALFDMGYYLPDDLLVKVDRASMYFALETRVPLLDYRIVEWALNLPMQFKLHNGHAKWMLRQLLFEYIPPRYFDRPKRGFSIPLQQWLKKELKDFAMDYLNEAAINKVGVLNKTEVKKLLDAFYTKNQHYLYNRVWQLLVLQKWFLQQDS